MWFQGLPPSTRKNAPNRDVGGCALGTKIPLEIRLFMSGEELSGKTENLPVEAGVLEKSVTRAGSSLAMRSSTLSRRVLSELLPRTVVWLYTADPLVGLTKLACGDQCVDCRESCYSNESLVCLHHWLSCIYYFGGNGLGSIQTSSPKGVCRYTPNDGTRGGGKPSKKVHYCGR